jgi:hypothetical protein
MEPTNGGFQTNNKIYFNNKNVDPIHWVQPHYNELHCPLRWIFNLCLFLELDFKSLKKY